MSLFVRTAVALGIMLVVAGCGDRSNQLSAEEKALYELALQDMRAEDAQAAVPDGPTMSPDMEIFLTDFFAYENHLSQLIELRQGLTEEDLAARLKELKSERRDLLRRKRQLFDPPQEKITDSSSLSEEKLTFALLNAASSSGPVKVFLDENIELKEELTDLIVTSRTLDETEFRARAVRLFEDIEEGIDDPVALQAIMETHQRINPKAPQ